MHVKPLDFLLQNKITELNLYCIKTGYIQSDTHWKLNTSIQKIMTSSHKNKFALRFKAPVVIRYKKKVYSTKKKIQVSNKRSYISSVKYRSLIRETTKTV